MKKRCEGCYYSKSADGTSNGAKFCHYMLETGEPKGCRAEVCDKRITRREYDAVQAAKRKKVLQNG